MYNMSRVQIRGGRGLEEKKRKSTHTQTHQKRARSIPFKPSSPLGIQVIYFHSIPIIKSLCEQSLRKITSK